MTEIADVVITKEALEVLKDQKPFIELINHPDNKLSGSTPINRGDLGDPAATQTDCGWVVYYYPPKNNLPARVRACMTDIKEEAVAPEFENLSIEHQTMRTAFELIGLLAEQGWENFKIEQGSPRFKWSVWAVCKHLEANVTGFKAEAYHKNRLEHCGDILDSMTSEILGVMEEDVPQDKNKDKPGDTK